MGFMVIKTGLIGFIEVLNGFKNISMDLKEFKWI
jgi:hypothetical protein